MLLARVGGFAAPSKYAIVGLWLLVAVVVNVRRRGGGRRMQPAK